MRKKMMRKSTEILGLIQPPHQSLGTKMALQLNWVLMKTLLIAAVLIGIAVTPSLAQAGPWQEGAGHLRLAEDLDRAQDGYCLDVVGSGQYPRFDLPLIAHNCKPGLYADEAVIMESNGYIRFPAYNKCATVAGLNSRALPGAALVPRDCAENSPFLDAEKLQKFHHREDGRIELAESGLCLTVARKSDSTFSPDHRWRPLYVESCEIAEPARSRWKFVISSL
jgi:hypothetical protein